VTGLEGFGAGTYTIASYTGALSDSGLLVGSMPEGFTGSIETSGGSVRLIVNAILSPYQEWQAVHFGSTADPAGSATADPDGDGSSNEVEFRLGLDPMDGSSAFRASGSRSEAGFTISWPAAPGAQFEVRRAGGMEGPWQVIGTTNGVGNFTDTEPLAGRAFYRIVLLP
jgi:fibronectin-binding autotransporter adhesin